MKLAVLTEQLFGLCKMELNTFFYLPSFIRRLEKALFRKAYIIHTINLVEKAYIMLHKKLNNTRYRQISIKIQIILY